MPNLEKFKYGMNGRMDINITQNHIFIVCQPYTLHAVIDWELHTLSPKVGAHKCLKQSKIQSEGRMSADTDTSSGS